MATLDGLDRRVLFNSDDGLKKPRAIVVDPSEGLLFGSDWGTNAYVFSSGLDGEGKRTLSSNFLWPNGLTLDLNKKKLYILDGLRGTLSYCNYDGSNFQELFKSSAMVQEAFGLTYFSNKLYWTSWKEKALMSINVETKYAAAIYKLNRFSGVQRMMGVKVVHASLQPELPRSNSCDNKGCSHMCVPGRQGKASCMCPFGFALHHDEKTCIEEGYLLVSWRRTIRRYNLHSTLEQPLIDVTKAAISIDFHLKKRLVFWSDIEEHRIYRAPLEQLNNMTIVATVETCDGLAVDWIHDVLYWTDIHSNVIEAAYLDGSNKTTIVNQDLDQPRAVALDPLEGLMFWTDWGTNPKIESANLDGSNRKIIVKNDVVWPNGLTIDLPNKIIYWADGMLKMISSCLYDGSQRRQILGTQIVSLQPFGISVLDDYLYWTDWSSQTVMKTRKLDILAQTKVLSNSSSLILRPNGIKVVHSSLQIDQDNPCTRMNCKSLCVGSSSGSTKGRCMEGEPEPIIFTAENVSVPPTEINELDDTTINNVRNDSVQLSFGAATKSSYFIITWKCSKREGCTVDTNCTEGNEQTKVFPGDGGPITISGLLSASRYNVRLRTSTGNIRDVHVTTSMTDPPELPTLRSVDVKGTNVTIKWDPVDTCVPDFSSYNYRIYRGDQLVTKGKTNLTEVLITNLQPLLSYTMHLFTSKKTHYVSATFEIQSEDGVDKCLTDEFTCDGKRDCSDGRDEAVNLCAGIEKLIVYKKTKSEVYFRCVVTNRTAKGLLKFSGNFSAAGSALEEQFESPAVPCSIWPESFCFNISNLGANKMYTFNVSAVVKNGTHGNPVKTEALTKEGIPGPPEHLHMVSYTPTSVDIQWHYPNQSNGVLRNFIINIHEVETFEEDKCCTSFSMTEAPVSEETAIYSATTGGLSPASTYAISVTFKTLYLGGSVEIDVHTAPPPLEILRVPELEVSSLTRVSWLPRDEQIDNQAQYNTLIKYYVLLLITPNAGQQVLNPLNSSIEIEPIKPLLEIKLGADFSVLWKINANDTTVFKDPIPVRGLTTNKQYELAWVQVSQYKDAFGLDHILSKPFIAV